jgi:hypothetical protein
MKFAANMISGIGSAVVVSGLTAAVAHADLAMGFIAPCDAPGWGK